MSRLRQKDQLDENDIMIRVLGLKLSKGHIIEGHSHTWGQVIFATRGVMQVDAADCRWIVPPQRCLWMPSNTDHKIRIVSETWMRTIYLKPDLTTGIAENCRVLNVTSLLREIILEIVRLKMLSQTDVTHLHLTRVLIDQLIAADEMSMKIKMPTDPRAVRLANVISTDPANRATLKELSKATGASPRTLERLYVRETGLSVGRWRQQMRLMTSVRLLVEGKPINQVAFESGYESPSAFVAMFRREIGFTPGQYIRNLKQE